MTGLKRGLPVVGRIRCRSSSVIAGSAAVTIAVLCVVAILALSLLTMPCHAQHFWKQLRWPSVSLHNGYAPFDVYTIVATTNGYLFAGTRSGVYRSNDNGDHWTKANFGIVGSSVWTMVVDTHNVVFAVSRGYGVFRSTNLGEDWMRVNNGIRALNRGEYRELYGCCSDRENGYLYAGADSGIVYRSSNGGESWEERRVAEPSPVGMTIKLVAKNNDVYAASWKTWYRSTDHGEHWIATPAVIGPAVAEDSKGNLYAAGDSMHMSTDHGATWTRVNTQPLHWEITALAVDHEDALLAGSRFDGVWKSTDRGASWSRVATGTPHPYAISFISDDTVFVCDMAGALRSLDGGVSWTRASNGIGLADIAVVFPASSGLLFAGTYQGLFVSADNGASCRRDSNGISDMPILSMAEDQAGNLFVGGYGNAFLSSGSGMSWCGLNHSYDWSAPVDVAVDQRNGVLVCVPQTGLLRSSDLGATWENLSPGLTSSLYIGTRIVYAGQDTIILCIPYQDYGIYLSTNRGLDWSRRTNGLTKVMLHVCARAFGGELYAGTDKGIFLSTNAGESWEKQDMGLGDAPVLSVGVNRIGDVYAGIGDMLGGSLEMPVRLMRWTHGGRTWQDWSSGLGDVEVTSIAFDAAGYAWLGTLGDGVFRSEEVTLAAEPAPPAPDGRFTLAQNHPNPFTGSSVISFSTPDAAHVMIRIHDMLGREVAVLMDEHLQTGRHEVRCDGSRLPRGTYIVSLQADGISLARLMNVLR